MTNNYDPFSQPPANQRRPYRHVPSPTYYSRGRRRRKKKRKRNESAVSHSTLDESSERALPEDSEEQLDSENGSDDSETDSDEQDSDQNSDEQSGKFIKGIK